MQSEIFNQNSNLKFNMPLAEILRPKKIEDFYGQQKILDKNSLLRNAIISDKVGNIIFSGPPGVGKTTLVEIISFYTTATLVKLNAVLSGIKELRYEISLAETRWIKSKRKTILFIDEVHRFTSAQQDALLPSIENGTVTFIGATTESPYFAVNKALLSRSRVFKLLPLSEADLNKIVDKVIDYYSFLEDSKNILITQEARKHLIQFSSGDARNLINALELAVSVTPSANSNEITIDLTVAEDSIQNKKINYDKNGPSHFDVISAFIKSIRGSDPNATLYWLAYMIKAGEDPLYIFRRLMISASEDVGLADPNAIIIVNACSTSFDRLGLPEGLHALTQASLYLALASKSNSTKGIFKALDKLKDNNVITVPEHLRNNSSSYKNPHDYLESILDQSYLPHNLNNYNFWNPSDHGWEKNKYEQKK